MEDKPDFRKQFIKQYTDNREVKGMLLSLSELYDQYVLPLQSELSSAQEKDKWISVKERLPELNVEVICYQPDRKWVTGKEVKGRILTGRLFELKTGERDGFIDLHLLGDEKSYMGNGGQFWAFPYICHQNFVTHWRPLPAPPELISEIENKKVCE